MIYAVVNYELDGQPLDICRTNVGKGTHRWVLGPWATLKIVHWYYMVQADEIFVRETWEGFTRDDRDSK